MGKFFAVVVGLGIGLGIGALFAGFLQFVWNEAVAAAFNLPTLTFWQTWGCMIVVGFVGSCFRAVTRSK
jgi:uncharacterized membrane protein YdbT with pleckstrin-like domain